MMGLSRVLSAVGALVLAFPVVASAGARPVPSPALIEFSHSLDEERAERLEPLVEQFNSRQKDVVVKLVRRVEGEAPKQINLVTPEEYSRFLAHKAKFKPLYDVMREARESIDAKALFRDLSEGLVDARGRLYALPIAFSTPVLYYNKTASRHAGLNPERPPRTWAEMQDVAGKLVDARSKCAYTTSRPASVFIDNVSARDAASVSDAKGNLTFNGLAQVKHIAMMSAWFKSKYFTYFGRGDEADRRFAKGECAMLTSSSALYPSLEKKNTIEVGVSPLPYHDDVYGAPQNSLADGASLWMSGRLTSQETKGVAKFVKYILGTEVQAKLAQAGGFLPMTAVARAAADSALSALSKSDREGVDVAYSQLKGKASPPVRVARFEPIRDIVDEELEAVWANRKPAKEALDDAVARGNALLNATPSLKRGLIAGR